MQFRVFDTDIIVTPKKIRNIYLRICPFSGAVRVSAPITMNLDAIRQCVVSGWDWIVRQKEKFQFRSQGVQNRIAGDSIFFIDGRQFLLKGVEYGNKSGITLCDGGVVIHAPIGATQSDTQQILDNWCRWKLYDMTSILIDGWQKKMGVSVARFSVRKMKTRWGSCTPKTRSIRFGLELIKRPPQCLEYVVVHELAHLIEPSHNRHFVEIMDRYLPRWRMYRKQLNEFGFTVVSQSEYCHFDSR